MALTDAEAAAPLITAGATAMTATVSAEAKIPTGDRRPDRTAARAAEGSLPAPASLDDLALQDPVRRAPGPGELQCDVKHGTTGDHAEPPCRWGSLTRPFYRVLSVYRWIAAYVRVSMPMPVRFVWPFRLGRNLNVPFGHFVVSSDSVGELARGGTWRAIATRKGQRQGKDQRRPGGLPPQALVGLSPMSGIDVELEDVWTVVVVG